MQRSDPKMCSETSVADKIIRGCKLHLRPSASSVSFLCVHSLKGTGGSGVTSEQQWFLFLGTHWRTVWTGSLSTYSMRALTSCWHAHQVILWWLLQNKISCFSPFSGSTIIFIPSHFSGCRCQLLLCLSITQLRANFRSSATLAASSCFQAVSHFFSYLPLTGSEQNCSAGLEHCEEK